MRTESAAPDLTETLTRSLWPSFKRRLEGMFPGEEWVSAMYLFRAIRASEKQVHLLATLPNDGRVITGAQNRLPAMRKILAPAFCISLVRRPDAYEIPEARRRYGIDNAPKWISRREARA